MFGKLSASYVRDQTPHKSSECPVSQVVKPHQRFIHNLLKHSIQTAMTWGLSQS